MDLFCTLPSVKGRRVNYNNDIKKQLLRWEMPSAAKAIDLVEIIDKTMRLIQLSTVDNRTHETINAFLATIEKQILFWLNNPPKNNLYATNVMKAIINASLPQTPENKAFNGKLAYMRGLIREKSFGTIKANPKQAIIDYKEAVDHGNQEAFEKLGDIYFQECLKLPSPISDHPLFINAMMAYSKGQDTAKIKFVENGLLTRYTDDLQRGHLQEAIADIKHILDFCKQNPQIQFDKNVLALKDKIADLENLDILIRDSQRIMAQHLIARNTKNPDDMLRIFLDVKKQLELPNAPNPIFYYFYAALLEKTAILESKKKPPNKGKIKQLNDQAKEYYKKIIDKNEFPDFYDPLINFVVGFAKQESNPEFANKPTKSKAFYYFDQAAKGGCYLAYSYMGNLVDQDLLNTSDTNKTAVPHTQFDKLVMDLINKGSAVNFKLGPEDNIKSAPAASQANQDELRKTQEEIEYFLQLQIRDHFHIYEGLQLSPQGKEKILSFLSSDSETGNLIQRSFSSKSLGLLSRLFNNMNFVDENSLVDLALSFMKAIDNNKFAEWTTYRTSILVNLLLDDKLRLKDEILTLFANHCGISKDAYRAAMYGQPENPQKVAELAQQIVSACYTGLSLVISGAMAERGTNPIFKKLYTYSSYINGVTPEGELLPDNVTTFNTLTKKSLAAYQESLSNINVMDVLAIELNVLKEQLEPALIKVCGSKENTGLGMFDQSERLYLLNILGKLEDKEKRLMDVVQRALPGRSSVIRSFSIKLEFIDALRNRFQGIVNDADFKTLERFLRCQVEKDIVDNNKFVMKASALETLILERLQAILANAVPDDQQRKEIINEFHRINNAFANDKSIHYTHKLNQLQTGLKNLFNAIEPPSLGHKPKL